MPELVGVQRKNRFPGSAWPDSSAAIGFSLICRVISGFGGYGAGIPRYKRQGRADRLSPNVQSLFDSVRYGNFMKFPIALFVYSTPERKLNHYINIVETHLILVECIL